MEKEFKMVRSFYENIMYLNAEEYKEYIKKNPISDNLKKTIDDVFNNHYPEYAQWIRDNGFTLQPYNNDKNKT